MDRNPDQLTIPELQQAYRQGDCTVTEVTAWYLARIEHENERLRAVIAVNPGAEAVAADQQASLATLDTMPPLFGIPVLIKDNIETRELPTTAGSLALAENHTGRDAPVVERLREAGAIILGKANLSEWANFRSERSCSGWSAVGGQCVNAHDITRSPCGSSSGSATAVAAGLAHIAVGTETNGSIVCPASVGGIVGIKPTVGHVSQQGIVPISRSQDTAGPMARTVTDAAIALDVMAGTDGMTARSLATDALSGKRIGIVRSFAGFHEGVDACFEHALGGLEAAGVTLVDKLAVDSYGDFRKDSYNVLLYEFKTGPNDYLAGLPAPANELTLDALIEFNEVHRDAEMPWFGQEIFLKSREKGDLNEPEYLGALARAQIAARNNGIDKLLADHELDAIIAPSRGPAWTIDQINGDHGRGGAITGYAAIAGYPHVTVPMGRLHGLPLGLSFVGTADSDTLQVSLAYAFEQISGR